MAVKGEGEARPLASGPGGVNVADSANEPVVRTKVAGDAFDRYVLTADGTAYIGDGTDEPAEQSGTSGVLSGTYDENTETWSFAVSSRWGVDEFGVITDYHPELAPAEEAAFLILDEGGNPVLVQPQDPDTVWHADKPYIPLAQKNAPLGVATLDADGKVVQDLAAPTILVPVEIGLLSLTTPFASTSLPAAIQEFTNNGRLRTKVDLSGASEFRVTNRQTATGASGCVMGVAYAATEAGTWKWLDGTAIGSVPLTGTAPFDQANTTNVGPWTAIDADALADVFIRPMTANGDGAASPSCSHISLQVR